MEKRNVKKVWTMNQLWYKEKHNNNIRLTLREKQIFLNSHSEKNSKKINCIFDISIKTTSFRYKLYS